MCDPIRGHKTLDPSHLLIDCFACAVCWWYSGLRRHITLDCIPLCFSLPALLTLSVWQPEVPSACSKNQTQEGRQWCSDFHSCTKSTWEEALKPFMKLILGDLLIPIGISLTTQSQNLKDSIIYGCQSLLADNKWYDKRKQPWIESGKVKIGC